MQLAVEQGWVLVLVEEAVDDRASPWSFAVDTVLSLEVTPSGRRELRVTKHRFASCQPGPHRLLVEREGVRVLPCFAAYRNAVRDLALPSPATNRSLRVPVIGQAPDWSRFEVPDGEGRVVIVCVNNMPMPYAFENFTAAIGATAQDGSAHPGARGTLLLSESQEFPVDLNPIGFHVGTLHQMIDGEEWLEAALSRLVACESPLAQVRIGPTERLEVYQHSENETLHKAISLLAAILGRRGLIVVVYGVNVHSVIRAGILSETWSVSLVTNPPPERLKIMRRVGANKIEFEAVMG